MKRLGLGLLEGTKGEDRIRAKAGVAAKKNMPLHAARARELGRLGTCYLAFCMFFAHFSWVTRVTTDHFHEQQLIRYVAMLLFKACIRDDPREAATLVTPVTGKHPVCSEGQLWA